MHILSSLDLKGIVLWYKEDGNIIKSALEGLKILFKVLFLFFIKSSPNKLNSIPASSFLISFGTIKYNTPLTQPEG